MVMRRHFDIVIVGGGIAGLSMAAAVVHTFAAQELRLPSIALIDAAAAPEQFDLASFSGAQAVDAYDPRVCAITDANIRHLQAWGVWELLAEARVGAFEQMRVWDGEGTANISFTAEDFSSQQLGAIVENRLLVAALYQRLQDLAAVHFFHDVGLKSIDAPPVEVGEEPHSISLKLNSAIEIEASMLIGADGAHSIVREQAGFAVRDWDYQQDAIVCTVRTARSHEDTAWQCFTRWGPLALLPLGEQVSARDKARDLSSVVWSLQRDVAAEYMSLEDATFAKRMTQSLENRLGEVVEVSKRHSFSLRQQHATTLLRGNVALVGDAAHTIHPLAGQGINLGIQDTLRLAEALANSMNQSGNLHSQKELKRFARERLTENLAMMAAVEGFKRLFLPSFSSVHLLRNRGMAFVDQQAWLKKRIARFALGY